MLLSDRIFQFETINQVPYRSFSEKKLLAQAGVLAFPQSSTQRCYACGCETPCGLGLNHNLPSLNGHGVVVCLLDLSD
jgi:hypothetical protein